MSSNGRRLLLILGVAVPAVSGAAICLPFIRATDGCPFDANIHPHQNPPVRVIQSHVGIVTPGSTYQIPFVITNDSQTRWTFARFETGCGCVVPQLEANYIDPGQRGRVLVSYLPSGTSRDELRRVFAFFSDKSAPIIQLDIHSNIREHLTITPTLLDFGPIRAGIPTLRHIMATNHTDSHWDTIRVIPLLNNKKKWATLQISEVQPTTSMGGRQCWAITVEANVPFPQPGTLEEIFRVEAGNEPTLSKQVIVRCRINPPATVTPPQIFFGDLVPNKVNSRKLVVRLNDDVSDENDLLIRAIQGLPAGVCAKCEKVASKTWHLSVTVTAMDTELGQSFEGLILVDLGTPDLPPLEIPVMGCVIR